MGGMVNYRLTCDMGSQRGSLIRVPLLHAHKSVVHGGRRFSSGLLLCRRLLIRKGYIESYNQFFGRLIEKTAEVGTWSSMTSNCEIISEA